MQVCFLLAEYCCFSHYINTFKIFIVLEEIFMESVLYVNLSIPSIMGMEANPVDRVFPSGSLPLLYRVFLVKNIKVLPDL